MEDGFYDKPHLDTSMRITKEQAEIINLESMPDPTSQFLMNDLLDVLDDEHRIWHYLIRYGAETILVEGPIDKVKRHWLDISQYTETKSTLVHQYVFQIK